MSSHADPPIVARPTLQGERVRMRPPIPRDKADRLALGREPEFVFLVGGDTYNLAPLTPERVQRWYTDVAQSPHSWNIDVDGRCIGNARLHSLNEHDRRARYAIGIFDAACWGHGYGTEATRLVLAYAFDTLQLHRVDLRVLAVNRRAIASYEKCGFVREGVERDSALIDGVWHDDLIMSILEHEWRNHGPTTDEVDDPRPG
jgi:ribosomal-protein-alanine N-acetyltransferase